MLSNVANAIHLSLSSNQISEEPRFLSSDILDETFWTDGDFNTGEAGETGKGNLRRSWPTGIADSMALMVTAVILATGNVALKIV